MSRSTKAVLLSALVLPGAGQLYLNQFTRGIALIALSLVCLGVIVSRAIGQASAVLTNLELDGGTSDASQISSLVNQASNGSDSSAVTLASLVLAAGWLAGIVDAYRVGRQQDGRKEG
jgi:Mn2+/Fe2+ NRAMP family transporter